MTATRAPRACGKLRIVDGKAFCRRRVDKIDGDAVEEKGVFLLGDDADAVSLMRSMGAKRIQIFRYIKLPGALTQFFSGLKVSASYAVVGAVISEWLGGFEGLGVYMTRVKKAYAFDKMFSVIIFISVISLLLMLLIAVIKRLCTPWERTKDERSQTE